MNRPRGISVIICTWNRSGVLKETLDSLNAIRIPRDIDAEVVVVDNNSSDGTRGVVEAAMRDWRLGRLRYEFEPRQGKQFALNTAIAKTSHDVLAFTDDDVLFEQDWLELIADVFTDPAVELAGGKTLVVWPPSGRPVWYDESMMAVLACVDLGDRKLAPVPPDYSPAGTNLIARRSLFGRLGGYSELHFRHMDHEFGQRCVRAGAGVVYDPRLVVHAPVDPRILSKRYFRRWYFKAGIARDAGESADQAAHEVPRWVYRRLLEDMAWVATHVLSGSRGELFARELRCWRMAGKIAAARQIKRAPGQYADWVAKHSQKRSDIY